MLKELNAKIGRELVKSFVNVFVRLLIFGQVVKTLLWVGNILTLCPRKVYEMFTYLASTYFANFAIKMP